VRRTIRSSALTSDHRLTRDAADTRDGGAAQTVGERIGVHVGEGEDRVPAGPSGLWGALTGRSGDVPEPAVVSLVDPMFPSRAADDGRCAEVGVSAGE